MSQSASERFCDELKNINDYVSYIENNFYQRSCSVIRTEGYEDLGILSDYVFFADTKEEKEENKRIIDSLQEIVDRKIAEFKTKISQMQRVELPAMSGKIIEKDLAESLFRYIESEVYDCMDNPENLPAFKLILKILPSDLKRK